MSARPAAGSDRPAPGDAPSDGRPVRPRRLFALAALALAVVAGACGEGPTQAGPGELEVTAATSGEDVDADGYTLVVDGEESRSLGVDETVTSSGVPPGRYVLELTEVSANCTVQGDNPRTLRVSTGSTASTTFEVVCSGRTGDLEVTTSTSGSDPDTDGYTVTVDGTRTRDVGPDGSVTYEGLAAGDHEVRLGGVANNCTVEGENPRSATVPFGDTGGTAFEVTCSDAVGDLEVSTSTTGDDPDDDYEVVLDGTQRRSVAGNGSVTFEGVAAGEHEVTLEGVAANCSVDGEAGRSVTVPNGGEAEVAFEVECSDAVGDLVVSAETSGDDPDDAYEVVLDGTESRTLDANGEVEFDDLAAGDHEVELLEESVAENCDLQGGSARTATVPNGGETEVAFSVDCETVDGDLVVSTTTEGDDPGDGYTVQVDGGERSREIGPDDEVTFEDVPAGDHGVELTGVADDCTVEGDNPRTVTVPAGETESTEFAVDCTEETGDLQVTTSTTGGEPDDGYTVEVDGGARSETIGPNGQVTFEDLSAGDHGVELTGLGDCSVDGGNPRTVTVPAGGTATADFAVDCPEETGGLQVGTATQGDEQDDGYVVEVDGGARSEPIGPNDEVTFEDLQAGEHGVALADVADNCGVQGDNPRQVEVPAGDTGSTVFQVECEAVAGDLVVSTETEGDEQDDGYAVEVDGGARSEPIGADDEVTFEDLQAGDHGVALADVADNCAVEGDNPRQVEVPAGESDSTEFEVECEAAAGDLEVTATTRGPDPDDRYTVVLDPGEPDEQSVEIDANGDVLFGGLPAGDHRVALDDLADGCEVDGDNPRTVAVPPGATTGTEFLVGCGPEPEILTGARTSDPLSSPLHGDRRVA